MPRRRQQLEPFADHLRRPGEEAIGVRIIGRPHDLMRADTVGQHGEASLDWLEGDPAIPFEELARTRLQAGIVEAQVIEMPVHRPSEEAIQPPQILPGLGFSKTCSG
jgi:hypothetical protein